MHATLVICQTRKNLLTLYQAKIWTGHHEFKVVKAGEIRYFYHLRFTMALQLCLLDVLPLARTDFIPVPHVYTSHHEYPTMEAHYNRSYFARTLPPVPKNCPTPFGVAGMLALTNLFFLVFCFSINRMDGANQGRNYSALIGGGGGGEGEWIFIHSCAVRLISLNGAEYENMNISPPPPPPPN